MKIVRSLEDLKILVCNGAWLSLVERLNGVQEVTGSSPVAPTYIFNASHESKHQIYNSTLLKNGQI